MDDEVFEFTLRQPMTTAERRRLMEERLDDLKGDLDEAHIAEDDAEEIWYRAERRDSPRSAVLRID